MNLLSMLLGSLTADSSIGSLVNKLGLSPKQITKLITAALPVLLKFLTQNASSASGAQSLLSALTQHTNKKTMALQIEEADQEDGGKIISHILGKESGSVMNELAKESGLSANQVSQVLSNMAPALMSGLSAATTTAQEGKAKGKFDLSDGLDFSDLAALFGGSAQSAASGNDMLGSLLGGASSGLGGLLGGSADSAAGGFGSFLGSLLGGKKKKEEKVDTSAFDGSQLMGILSGLMK